MMMPAPRPCQSCPYRRDVPSGVWSSTEYAKLVEYDAPTYAQPLALFQCHQNGADDGRARACAGWVGCHGQELLALRLAVSTGAMDAQVMGYRTAVSLFASGGDAAVHGMRDVQHPGPQARALIEKITTARADIT